MSVPNITNAREYAEAVAELFALARPDGKERTSDLLTAVVHYSERTAKEAAPAMSRVEAVELAIKHVEKLSTNSRGYAEGANGLPHKTQAVEAFVRLLLGEPSSSRE